jgi:hypothetical protein
MMLRVRLAFAALSLVVGSATGAIGQQAATSTLGGRVSDPAGAVIAGARVTLTHKATGARRETLTNEDGLYVLTNLSPGEYEMRIEQTGFKQLVSSPGLTLLVGQQQTFDATLEVGRISDQTIEQVGTMPLVNRESAIVDGTIDARQIASLPLNGRNYLELALLIPGNSPAPNFDPTKAGSVIISSAGQLGRGGNITIDGTDNNDDAVGGPLANISQDAVQEFQIATNRFSAEIGRSASSVINVVTRSGTNQLHGSFSFFARDEHLQALPATYERSLGRPPFDRQQYAATLGGPLARDRAWLFGAFEYRNQDGAVQVGERDVAARRIRRTFASAPHDDLLGLLRADWKPSESDSLSFRYALERLDDTGATKLDRAIGSASQRQRLRNHHQVFLANYTRVFSPAIVNSFSFSVNNFSNATDPLASGPQLTFPSIQDGVSFRVPQATKLNRLQFSDSLAVVRGAHALKFGGELQRVDSQFDLGVFQAGRIELVQDFAGFDHNGDGRVDDGDLLFAVTLRSSKPTQSLLLADIDNHHLAFFAQDDWRVSRRLALNLGLRYELDTNANNNSWYESRNPLVASLYRGDRERDKNNFAPRVGFNWATEDGRTSVHGGYGIYYDRVTLEIASLERGLDGRALAIEVRAGNALSDPSGAPIFIDPATGRFRPFAPTLANPFTGFILLGAGASGINLIDNGLQNPMVQQFNLGIQRELARDLVLRADYLHNFGTRFIIGRTVGRVDFNPVVGGPDRVVNLESSVKTKYDGLLLSLEKRFSNRYQFRASYTLSKAFNYANDDQIPFSNGPVNSENLRLEYGPTPNDRRHYFTLSGAFTLPYEILLAPILTLTSGVPMDILLPDASSRIPVLQRNAGGRLFKTGAELNAFLNQLNAAGGINGQPLPLVRDEARFNDGFSSFDLRLSKLFRLSERVRLEPIVEVFNLFNVTNILGISNVNYSGFSNVLVRDSQEQSDPGFLRSSGFGQPVTTAGGVFGSGGPRAFQFAARLTF